MKWYLCFPLLLLFGCAAVGPDYQRPKLNLAPQYVNEAKSTPRKNVTEAWWRQYKDPLLESLVERGLRQSFDVMAAIERIREAQASLRATGVNAALSGSLDGQYMWEGGSDIDSSHTASGSLGAAFVIDLFGGIRREREGALADLVYAQANVEVTRLAWLAEFIAAYANTRYYRTAFELTTVTVQKRKETVAITRLQLEAGASTEYELAEAEALLATAEADIPKYKALFAANVYAMATLLNEDAGPLLAAMKSDIGTLAAPTGDIATGLPADLLRNRPDIRCSEASLAAAVAEVGMAEAELYPAIALSGTLSLTEGASTWGFGPSLSLPIFNRGALSAERDAKISAATQAEISYRAEVLAAVEDVQVAQSNLAQYRLRATSLTKAAATYEHALELARVNYRSGAITLLDLLDTDRSAASASISAASADNDVFQQWASLQIALGSGASATDQALAGDTQSPKSTAIRYDHATKRDQGTIKNPPHSNSTR